MQTHTMDTNSLQSSDSVAMHTVQCRGGVLGYCSRTADMSSPMRRKEGGWQRYVRAGVNSVKLEPEGMCIVMSSVPVVCAAVLALQGLPAGVLGQPGCQCIPLQSCQDYQCSSR
jgi:hypothetical protein